MSNRGNLQSQTSAMLTSGLRVKVASLSDTGRQRTENQDRVLTWDLASREDLGDGGDSVRSLSGGVLLAVCDGMGGHGGGELASTIAADTLREHARNGSFDEPPEDPTNSERWLEDGIDEANRAVIAAQLKDSRLKEMGTTATAVTLLGGKMTWAHVGDSRLYHLREGRLRQLTIDHSFVGRLVAAGQITYEESRSHEDRNLLTQAVGTTKDLEVDTGSIPVKPDDRILICCDGLYDLVSEESIMSVLVDETPPNHQCEKLVMMANDMGGFDNISAVIAHVLN